MSSDDPEITFAEALEVLREGSDDTYGDRSKASSEFQRTASDLDLDASEAIGYPGVEQAIWRYQHHGETSVEAAIESAINRQGYPWSVDEVIVAIRRVAAELQRAE